MLNNLNRNLTATDYQYISICVLLLLSPVINTFVGFMLGGVAGFLLYLIMPSFIGTKIFGDVCANNYRHDSLSCGLGWSTFASILAIIILPIYQSLIIYKLTDKLSSVFRVVIVVSFLVYYYLMFIYVVLPVLKS